jgi:hypothetical protein
MSGRQRRTALPESRRGSRVVRGLARAGAEVEALVRQQGKVASDVTEVIGDPTDEPSMRARPVVSGARESTGTMALRLKGLRMKSSAPAFIASTALATLPAPVMTTPTNDGSMRWAAFSMSMPSISGILKSVRSMSQRALGKATNAALADVNPTVS